MRIVYIQDPKYEVDFQSYETNQQLDKQSSVLRNIVEIGRISLTFFFTIASASIIATWKTVKSSPTSFKYTVLYNFECNFVVVILTIVDWVIGLGMCWMTLFFTHLTSKFEHIQLEDYADPGLDPSHIVSAEAELDASSVSKDIQVRTLLDVFDQINFTESTQPVYFPDSARESNGRVYPVEELRNNLSTFINHVENRVAFLGTPPAYNTEKLLTYYQYIEDATRLILEKVLNDIKQFEENHPTVVQRFKIEVIAPSERDYSLAKKYQSLLENRSRLALDLAFTGELCGGRYTGDVAVAYNLHCNQNAAADLSLRGQLHSLLSHKRREIADSYIANLPTHAFGQSHNTHTYSEYMQKLGGVLGLPGTANIIEHLSLSAIDTNDALTSFFSEYSEDYIIEAIQQKFRDSQSFREAVYEWLKSNVGEWKKDANAQEPDEIIKSINTIKKKADKDVKIDDIKTIQHLNQILEDLQNKNVGIPKEIPHGSTFIEEMFALKEVKDSIEELFKKENSTSKNDIMKKMRFQNSLKEKMRDFASKAKDWTPIDVEEIKRKLILNAKIQEVKSHIQFGENTDEIIKKMLEGKSVISEVVSSRLKKNREADFLAEINKAMLNSNTVSLSKELIEWLLVDHSIFMPQVVPKASDKKLTSEEKAFKDQVMHYQEYKRSINRYFVSNSKTSLKMAFDKAFQVNPLKIIELAESASISYPLYRRVSLIEIPRAVSNICNNLLFQLIFSVAGGLIIIFSSKKALEILGEAFISKGLPFLSKHIPRRCYMVLNSTLSFITHVRAHPLYLALYGRYRFSILLIKLYAVASVLYRFVLIANIFSKDLFVYGQKSRKKYLESRFVSLAS